ncbi:MAG: DUF3568 family protein [Phycisphaerales bacterium]
MNRSTLLVAPVLVAAILPLGGCLVAAVGAGAAAGVGTYAYVTGRLETTQEVAFERAWSATEAGIADLQFTVVEKKKDAIYGELRAKMADGTAVKVTLQPASDTTTNFSIRVGTFGDEAKSQLVMDKIKARF